MASVQRSAPSPGVLVMNDNAIEELMVKMKAEGRSSEDIGYAVSKAIYGETPTHLDLKTFEWGLDLVEPTTVNEDDRGFVAGSRKFCDEQLRRFQ